MGLRRGTNWEAAVKASHEAEKGRIHSQISKLKDSSVGNGTEKVLKGKEIYGPYYEEAMELYRKNPEWYPNPDESFIVHGEELDQLRRQYESLVRKGSLEKGHHVQGLAFGGKNINENIKFTGESTIRRKELGKVDLDFYHQKGYGKKVRKY